MISDIIDFISTPPIIDMIVMVGFAIALFAVCVHVSESEEDAKREREKWENGEQK